MKLRKLFLAELAVSEIVEPHNGPLDNPSGDSKSAAMPLGAGGAIILD